MDKEEIPSAATGTSDKTPSATAKTSEVEAIAAALAKLTPETKPLSGMTSVGAGAGFIAELTAYSTLDNSLGNRARDVPILSIAEVLKTRNATDVLVVEDRALLDSTWSYEALTAQLRQCAAQVERASQSLTPPPAQPSGGGDTTAQDGPRLVAPAVALELLVAVPKIIASAADVVGMFRTNYTVAARTMTPEATPLLAHVARILMAAQIKVRIDGFEVLHDSPVVASARALADSLDVIVNASTSLRSEVSIASRRLATLDTDRGATATALIKQLAEEKNDGTLRARLHELDQEIERLDGSAASSRNRLAFVDQVIATTTAFLAALLTPVDGGRSPLLAAVSREGLFTSDGPKHVLFVSLDCAGAEVITPTSQMAKTDHILYSGGSQISYLLYSVADHSIVASGVGATVKHVDQSLRSGTITVQGLSELH